MVLSSFQKKSAKTKGIRLHIKISGHRKLALHAQNFLRLQVVMYRRICLQRADIYVNRCVNRLTFGCLYDTIKK